MESWQTGEVLMREYKAGVLTLTFICGLVDAVCFLALGGLFAELMTGNLLTMAFSIGTRNFDLSIAFTYACAIVPFCLGALVAGLVINGHHPLNRKGKPPIEDRVIGYPLEFAMVLGATAIALIAQPAAIAPFVLGTGQHEQLSTARLTILAMLAFGMGIHNALMRRRGVPDIATNVMTLTMTGVISESSLAGGDNKHWQRRLGSIALFMCGAAIGAYLLTYGVAAPLLLASIAFAIALYPLMKGRNPAALHLN